VGRAGGGGVGVDQGHSNDQSSEGGVEGMLGEEVEEVLILVNDTWDCRALGCSKETQS
jgi:hypothetical protein